ncbi:MAG: hypothetical protein ABSB34_12460 [Candidatus Limnocylindrales bacterium]|jgi:hypothetical protein
MPSLPLHHIVRIRTSDDLKFIRPGVMDEVLVNANLLENCPESTATALRETTLPYSIDPMLTRFQMPAWWRNEKGETKRNYARLGAAYVKGTGIGLAEGPLVQTVPSDTEWRALARNVIEYQQDRLVQIRPQLELFRPELHPIRFVAPALVAFSAAEDRINRLLAEASSDTAGVPIGVPVVVPEDRLRDAKQLDRLVASLPTHGISSYFLWTPRVTEELLLADHELLAAFLRLISTLADRGIPVGHLHATYLIAALHDYGISAVVHHMGWIDKGEPADQVRGGLRSCQTYVPGIRRCVRFARAYDLGRSLDDVAYAERYCDCAFCVGSFDAGQHPLDLLLEDQTVRFQNGCDRPTPTSRAIGLNTWHYVLSRRQEVGAFSANSAIDVLERDIQRAAALAGHSDSERLRRLATGLLSA